MPSGVSTERMYLIDAHSLIFQVFHAIPEMSSPSGLPTNALFGFTRDLLYLRTEKRPDYLVCAFDIPGPTFREKIYAEYKAHRAPMPTDLQAQLPLIWELLAAMRIPVLGMEGFEADDIVATVARMAGERGVEVMICTGDKDCRQLITDRVRLYNLRKRQEFGRAELQADWCITPEQVVDLQTLVGDTVDNVPGVRGIGLKTAAKLLKEYGSLDNIVGEMQRTEVQGRETGDNGQKAGKKVVGPKTWENLRQALPKLEMSRQLVRLDTSLDVRPDWDGWRLQKWDTSRLLALFREWGFHTLADQVRALSMGDLESAEPVQQELFPFGANLQSASADDSNATEERSRDEDGLTPSPLPLSPAAGERGLPTERSGNEDGLTPSSLPLSPAAGERGLPTERSGDEVCPTPSALPLFPAEGEEGSDEGARAAAPPDTDMQQTARNGGWKADYRLVDGPEEFQTFLSQLSRQKRLRH